jgi:pimeloyl-ACP methyl ester carboxylesterase
MPSSYLFLNGIRAHYLHWNVENGRKPVVLLHGLASNARIWELVAPFLAEWGFQVFALDQRGHGLTDKPDGDYGFDTFRGDLLSFIDACQLESPLLIGHSWGALVALDYAAQFPIGPRAPAGLVLVDGGVNQLNDSPGATWEQTRQRLAPPRLAGTPLDDFLALLSGWTKLLGEAEQVQQIILANFEISEDETISPRLTFERHMQIVRAMWDFKTYERLGRLRCQVEAVLALPPEPRTPQEEEYVALKQRGAGRAEEQQPRMRVQWMADTVHDIPLHRPAELARLIKGFASRV